MTAPMTDLTQLVGKLVWEPSPEPIAHDHWVASALGGDFHMAPDDDSPGVWLLQWAIRPDDFCMSYGGAITRYSSPESAKAAAEADYAARIIAALDRAALAEMLAEARADALRLGYRLGFEASSEGWNGEYPFDGEVLEADARWLARRDRSLSSIIDKE
jgi:hypothetical protein